MSAQSILYLILGILIISYAFGRWMSWLNLRHHKPQLPDTLSGHYDADKYARSFEYHRVNYRFGLLQGVLGFLVMISLLAFGGFGWIDAQLRSITTHPVGLPLLFFGLLYILSDLSSIPFQWYHTFVIEERFGFNRMKPRLFWIDKFKGYLLTAILGGLIMGTLLYLIDWLGEGFWIWFWIFSTLFLLFINFFYTTLLLPIFNKLTPLDEGSLREAIESYSEKVSFPLDNIFVIDGSKRSAKSNAFFSGFGKRKKVVLYDTLIENHEIPELIAILAHEVGHYKRRHVYQGFGLGVLQTGLILFILSMFVNSPLLSEAMGAEQNAIHLNLLAFGILFSPISTIIGIFMNIFSRKNEFEADHYAATTFEVPALKEALIRLHQENLSNLTPHPLFVFMNYSHPPLLQRLAALETKA